jgi:hypothetical protein
MLRALLGRKNDTQVIDTPEKLAQALGAGYESNAGQRVTTTSAMQQLGCIQLRAGAGRVDGDAALPAFEANGSRPTAGYEGTGYTPSSPWPPTAT